MPNREPSELEHFALQKRTISLQQGVTTEHANYSAVTVTDPGKPCCGGRVDGSSPALLLSLPGTTRHPEGASTGLRDQEWLF